MRLEVKKLTKELVPDFYRVNCESNNLGWCNCVAWSCSWEEFKGRTAEQNKNQREQLFAQGEYDGYLLYADKKPVAWSQCGPRARLKKLCEIYKLSLDENVWAISCFALIPAVRNKGLSKEFLRLIIESLRELGVKYVQGFPVRETKDPWTGPESVYKSAGFVLEKDDPKIPIYGIQLS